MYKIKFISLLAVSGIAFGSLSKTEQNIPVKNTYQTLPDNEFINSNKSLSKILDIEKVDRKKIALTAEKLKYRLTLYYEGKAIKSYHIVLGTNPVDDKLKEGDGCTPEGSFKVKSSYRHSKWNKFIWLNYPTVDSWKKYTSAKYKGLLKFSDSIGGKFGIRGVPENDDSLIDKKINWTNGDISLKNNDIDEIYSVIRDGTPVEIYH